MDKTNKNTNIARVAKVNNDKNIVINKGSNAGIEMGQVFLVYKVGDEVFDPETEQSLGYIEIVKGKGTVTHLQDTMATITSTKVKKEDKRIIYKTPTSLGSLFSAMYGGREEILEDSQILPFDGPEVGDFAKLI